MFYICSELNCNRKYKTKNKLTDHLLMIHNVVNAEISDPVEITKDNRKQIKERKNEDKKEEQRQLLIKEIETKKQIELIAKQEAEETFKQMQIERFKSIEEEKLKLEEDLLTLMQNNSKCSICMEGIADTAAIPCGHKSFCHSCIDNYHKSYPHKGCPVCRQDIMMITKIF